jgi:hypothetical protein
LRIGEAALVIRAGIDDKHQSVRDAALQALVSLICPPNGDKILRVLETVYRGTELLPLASTTSDLGAEQDDQTIEADIAAVQTDVVVGLVTRAQLLPRLRYLLEMNNGSSYAESLILSILLQCAIRSVGLTQHFQDV